MKTNILLTSEAPRNTAWELLRGWWTQTNRFILSWRAGNETRRQLLAIDERSLRDIGLDDDESLRVAREQFRRRR